MCYLGCLFYGIFPEKSNNQVIDISSVRLTDNNDSIELLIVGKWSVYNLLFSQRKYIEIKLSLSGFWWILFRKSPGLKEPDRPTNTIRSWRLPGFSYWQLLSRTSFFLPCWIWADSLQGERRSHPRRIFQYLAIYLNKWGRYILTSIKHQNSRKRNNPEMCWNISLWNVQLSFLPKQK